MTPQIKYIPFIFTLSIISPEILIIIYSNILSGLTNNIDTVCSKANTQYGRAVGTKHRILFKPYILLYFDKLSKFISNYIMSKTPSPTIKIVTSIGLGLTMAVVSWIVFYISSITLGHFIPEVRETELEIASAVRTSLYLMQAFFSIQVWFFSTLYFFDRYRR